MPDLSDKQRKFAAEYLIDQNATQAAIRAGYSAKTARQQGARLLSHVDIQALIATKAQQVERRAAAVEQRIEISAERTLAEIARIGYCDPVQMLDDDGKLLPVSKWPEDARRAIASIKTRRVVEGSGEDAHEVEITEVKFWDKNSALEKLAKHHALYAGEQPGTVINNTYNHVEVTIEEARADLGGLLNHAIARATAGQSRSDH